MRERSGRQDVPERSSPLRAGTACLIEGHKNPLGPITLEPYRLRIKYLCEDLDALRRRLKDWRGTLNVNWMITRWVNC